MPLILKMGNAAPMIVSFASERGTDLAIDEVIGYINEMDDDDWDID